MHTFFYKNGIKLSEPVVFLNSSQIFGNVPPTPIPKVELKMLLLMSDFLVILCLFLAFKKISALVFLNCILIKKKVWM